VPITIEQLSDFMAVWYLPGPGVINDDALCFIPNVGPFVLSENELVLNE
jgi:hypothetical protein